MRDVAHELGMMYYTQIIRYSKIVVSSRSVLAKDVLGDLGPVPGFQGSTSAYQPPVVRHSYLIFKGGSLRCYSGYANCRSC